MTMISSKRTLAGLAVAAGLLAPACWAATGPPAAAPSAVFAVVDGTVISEQELNGALAAAVRQKFYHRQPPDDQLAALREEVAARLVNRVLLLKEAQRRGIRPDEEKVRADLAAYEKRYRDRPQWQESRVHVLPALTRGLQEQSVITQLEAATRVAPPPTEAGLRAYYGRHPESFTEPERVRLSMILLKVDPSAPAVAWEQALEQAQDIVKQLRKGADFAALARLNSGDDSARNGGDLGYQHRGMLPAGVETEIDRMAPGAVSEPFRLLEGMAVFRLAERKAAQRRRLEDVRRNVAELWARDQGEAQWRELIARLRASAEIRIGGDRLPASAVDEASLRRQTAR
jgi:parvulin-like peptidyl-prolyl isomerase